MFARQSSKKTPVPSGLSPGDLSPPGSLAHLQPGYTAGQIPVDQHKQTGNTGQKVGYFTWDCVFIHGFWTLVFVCITACEHHTVRLFSVNNDPSVLFTVAADV